MLQNYNRIFIVKMTTWKTLTFTVVKFDEKLVFFIDEPLMQCSAFTILEKNRLFAEAATKEFLLKSDWNYVPQEGFHVLVYKKKSSLTARGRTWSSPPWSRRTSSNLLVAPLSKWQHPEYTNSVKEGLNAGLPCKQGHCGTVPLLLSQSVRST